MADVWEKLGPARFQADGEVSLAFMVQRLDIDAAIRLVRRPRPYRPGEKLDQTGRKAKEFQVEALFFNDLVEPDIAGGLPMWPDRLDALEAVCDLGKTGTLDLPWRKGVRAKLERVRRQASTAMKDGETASLTFIEDNEDNVDAAVLSSVSTSASVLEAVTQASFDMESSGMWDGSIEDFTQLAADLEGALNAPGEFLSDLAHKARRLQRAARSMRDSFSTLVEGRNQGLGPDGARAMQKLLGIEEMASKSLRDIDARLPPTTTRTFAKTTDIYQVAAMLGQSARDLIAINSEIPDLGFIEAGTPVRVFV